LGPESGDDVGRVLLHTGGRVQHRTIADAHMMEDYMSAIAAYRIVP
jgi:hypothetical protein